MTGIDFRAYARELAQDGGFQNMIPVIEKELLHYEILNAMDGGGFLNCLSFQGGTCLRLCYGGVRYSEDLDFAAGDKFNEIDPQGLADAVSDALQRRYKVSARVKLPQDEQNFGGVGVKRWWLIVDTAPERANLPSQRIKIEVASVPSHTKVVRPLFLNYPKLPPSYDSVLVECQSLEEILADKVVAFANNKAYVRYRDLWDMPWIWRKLRGSTADLSGLVRCKHVEYGCSKEFGEMLRQGLDKARQSVFDDEFVRQMARFLPDDVLDRTLRRPGYLDVLHDELGEIFQASCM